MQTAKTRRVQMSKRIKRERSRRRMQQGLLKDVSSDTKYTLSYYT